MSTLLVSSKGQIVLPAALRRRLGMGAGARIEVLEESDGLKLRVVRPVQTADLTGMAGMVKAPHAVPRGASRTLTRRRCSPVRGAASREGPGHNRLGPLLHRRCR